MSYFAGLDVSLRSVAICLIDHDGRVVRERTVAFEMDAVVAGLRSADQPIEPL